LRIEEFVHASGARQMGMKQTLEVINAMEADGVIGRHQGGVAMHPHWYRRCMPYTKKAMSQTIYPDVSDILARKKEGRREISRRSLGEKIAMVEAMRERLAPLKRIREERRANGKSAMSNSRKTRPQ
jgi:hypothetical protein